MILQKVGKREVRRDIDPKKVNKISTDDIHGTKNGNTLRVIEKTFP